MADASTSPAIISLTTDFGEGSRYVAAMKGVMLSINPAANLVDLSHSIPPQDVRRGAIVLAESAPHFPAGTIHVAVVDPGVGSDRRLVYAHIGNQQYLAPDNGLLGRLAEAERPSKIFSLDEPRFWMPQVSATFHGRDILAPVAARLSLGLAPEELGQSLEQLVALPWPEVQSVANQITGEVVEVDSFGNLITNITSEMLQAAPTDESVTVACDEHLTQGIFRTYSDQPPMTLIALVGSGWKLELAIVDDSAMIMLGVGVVVRRSWFLGSFLQNVAAMSSIPIREELLDWDRRHYWHAFTQMAEYEPLVIARAEGCRFFDVDGREYLDGAASMWCNVHGHRHPRIDAAVREQLNRVAHCTSLGMGCDTTVRLAKRLAELAPGDLQHVFFAGDGSSAVEAALKMAFQYWRQCERPRPEKTKFIALGDAYHGDTIGSASVGGIARFHALFEPLLFEVIRVPIPDPRRLPPQASPEEATAHFLAELEMVLDKHHADVAAMVIEPLVQFAAGIVIHPKGYLRGVRELTRRYDVLLIADEIASGMGRCGTLFACEQDDVVPDFLCLAKGLTGGYLPLSVTITHPEIYQAFFGNHSEGRALFHGHTYGGNPLGAAAALATLDVFDEEQTLAKLPEKCRRLGEHLCRRAEHRHVASVRQRGLLGAMDLRADKALGVPYPADERRAWRVCREALRLGAWIRPLGDTLYVAPPLAISLDEIDQLMEALSEAISTITCES